MFKKSIVSLLLLVISFCFAQNEANIWYFGNKAGMDFNSGSPVALTDGQMNTNEGCATISNAAGQLLFYTDGTTVWDRNHQPMPNGTGLLGDFSSTQSAIIIPKPNSSTIYYVFTCTDYANTNGIKYSEVDMSLNGGLGDITTNKNINLISGEVCEKLTAVKHGNGSDYWVMAHGYPNNTFYLFKVTALGVETTPVLNNIGTTISYDSDKVGYLKFSPDGSKLVAANLFNGLDIFDFNSNTGQLSNFQNILGGGTPYSCYGIEFSPSSKLLYVTQVFMQIDYATPIRENKLVQYDLMASNILLSEITLYSTFQSSFFYAIGALQLAPDGKIYLAINDNDINSHISVINNPDVLGTSCNFNVSFLNLSPGFVAIGLPQFIQSYFNASFTAQNFCLGSMTSFTLNASQTPTSVLWDFGDGSTSTSLNPTHQYASAGSYTVTVTATSTTGATNKSKQIVISPIPVIANSINSQFVCGNANQNYDLSQFNVTLMGSQSTSDFGVAYFSSMTNAVNHVNLLPTIQNLALGSTTFYAKVYSLTNTNCNAITSFTVTLNQKPIANATTDYILCENAPYDSIEQFNLSTKNAQVLGTQSASDFTITYHANQADADNGINSLPNLYTNTVPQETLYVRIENNLKTSCFSTTTLKISVIQQPQLNTVSDYKICDDNSNDGISSFDLSTKTTEVLNGQSATTFQVSYYASSIDAQNEASPITVPISNTSNNQTVYYTIKVVGNSNCKVTGTFKLVVNKLPITNSTVDYYQCDDTTNDGIGPFDLSTKNSSILGNQSLTDFNISYHLNQNDANSNSNSLLLNYQNTSNPQTIFVRLENKQNTSCYATTSFQIGLYKMPIAHKPSDIASCDDSSNNTTESFDFSNQTTDVLGSQLLSEFNITYHASQAEANSGTNALGLTYNNISNPQTIYVRIENKVSKMCFDTTSFQIIVRPKPLLNMTDVYSICQGSSITVSAPTGFSTYLWSNGITTASTTITQSGNYNVYVTKNYGDVICDDTKSFVVYNSNSATITNIATIDWTDNENSIIIYVKGDGVYEYSIDNYHYQDSNEFNGLQNGIYQVYVRDKKGCGITSEEVYLLSYPRFFTPNADGYNDYWQINLSEIEPNMKITIYDRYGKLLTSFQGKDKGWDGVYNNHLLPSDDYWFVVDRGNEKIYKGHFSLKR